MEIIGDAYERLKDIQNKVNVRIECLDEDGLYRIGWDSSAIPRVGDLIKENTWTKTTYQVKNVVWLPDLDEVKVQLIIEKK